MTALVYCVWYMFLLHSAFTEKPWLKQLSIARTMIRKHVHTIAWYSQLLVSEASPSQIRRHSPQLHMDLASATWNWQRRILQTDNWGVYLRLSVSLKTKPVCLYVLRLISAFYHSSLNERDIGRCCGYIVLVLGNDRIKECNFVFDKGPIMDWPYSWNLRLRALT